jgi:hypothetical protein
VQYKRGKAKDVFLVGDRKTDEFEEHPSNT